METGALTELEFNRWAIAAFVGYLLLISGLGVYAARFSSQGIGHFFIGGRKMNRFVVALSAVVSGRSSWLLLGVTGLAWKIGAPALWAVLGYTVVELWLFFYYAPRLRRFSEEHDCITVPDFFAERFTDRSGALRVTLAIVILIFMVSYVGAQLVGGGKAFAGSFGVQQDNGVLITAAIILVYTVVGGFLAVSLTDVVQAVFMIFALLFLPLIALFDAGGFSVVGVVLQTYDPSFMDPFAFAAGGIIGYLGIGFGSPGNPHIISRYMSIDSAEKLRFAGIVGTTWNVLMGVGALAIGWVGRSYYGDISMLPGSDPEQLFPLLARDHLHPAIFGVVIASVFAAIMSTADSQLLVAASSVIRDIYEKVVRKDKPLPEKKLVLYSRIAVLILVLISIVLALGASELVLWLVLFAWAGLGAALGPTSILALFWKKTTRAGVFAGVISGTVVTLLWYNIPALKSQMYELVPAFILSFILTVVVSLLTGKKTSR